MFHRTTLCLISLVAILAAAFLGGCSGSSGGSGGAGPNGVQLYPTLGTIGTQSTQTTPATGKLSGPSHSITLSTGDFVVADLSSSYVNVYDSTGNFISTLATPGSGPQNVNEPEGMCVDSNGNLYIVDSHDHRVVKYNSSLQWVTTYGNGKVFSDPEDVAVDSAGNLYVCDDVLNEIVVFNQAGSVVNTFGTAAGVFQLNSPIAVAISPQGQLYVVDMGNNRIVVFTTAGVGVTTFGSKGSAAGQFNHPSGACFDKNGNYYVNDLGNGAVQEFDSNNKFLFSYQVEDPASVADSALATIEGHGVYVDPVTLDIYVVVKSKLEVLQPHA